MPNTTKFLQSVLKISNWLPSTGCWSSNCFLNVSNWSNGWRSVFHIWRFHPFSDTIWLPCCLLFICCSGSEGCVKLSITVMIHLFYGWWDFEKSLMCQPFPERCLGWTSKELIRYAMYQGWNLKKHPGARLLPLNHIRGFLGWHKLHPNPRLKMLWKVFITHFLLSTTFYRYKHMNLILHKSILR